MTASDKTLIIRLWTGGVPIAEICKMLPYKAMHIKEMVGELRKDGTLPPRERGNKRQLVVDAYNGGMTNPYEIAETYGLTYGTVKAYLFRAGLKRPHPKHQYRPKSNGEKTAQILAALANKTQSEVARQFGVSRQWVSALKKRTECEQ